MTPDELTGLLTVLNTGGLVAALVYGIHLGLSGRVIPRHLVDEIITSVVREVLRELEKSDNP